MNDYLSIGASPAYEDCAQLGSENYYSRSKVELKALKNQMIRIVGEPPFGVQLKMKSFPHDFGTYYELIVVYDNENEEAKEFAFRCEIELPEHWDSDALEELSETGYPVDEKV